MLDKIPDYVGEVLSLLRACGYKAYAVGGCVRDILLGIVPSDWDIATDATPQMVMKALKCKKVIPTGIKHGTVTVVNCGKTIEVTTFRLESGYRDNRHPDSVSFMATLSDDLKRRDFTINAMCIDENGEIIDMFGGREDLNSRTLRAIGDPFLRFSEDALRILRALRFAACFSMEIDTETKAAIFKCKHRLSAVSYERIMRELLKIIKAPYCEKVLLEYKDIIFEIIPELRETDGVFQRQDYHCFDVWEHIVHAVGAIEPKNHLRLTMLLHDVGKPKCADGKGHFKGHAYKGAEISDKILRRMKCPNKTREIVVKLVRLHNMVAENTDEALRKLLYRYNAETMSDLIEIFKADNMAKRPEIAKARVEYYNKVEERLNRIIASNPPFTINNLAIKGQDIIGLGVEKGPDVGKILGVLNKMVAQDLIKNQKDKLLETAREIIFENSIETVDMRLQSIDNNDII